MSVPINKITKDTNCKERLDQLHKFFISQFEMEPDFFIRVPGRVNIIGEHIDYCGYPVLPMALDQCILLAVKIHSSDHFLQLRNMNSKFENFKCDLMSFSISASKLNSKPEWYNYFLCGVKGVFENLAGDFPKMGMFVALNGNVPLASGLSSSSALVSSATLATAYAFKFLLNKKTLATISARCEHYIGTQGGGMDQAIAYLAEKGCANFIEFHPELRSTSIKLPSTAIFVVANSLAEINKAATSDYNERVVECRTACRILSKKLGINNWRQTSRFIDLQICISCSLEELEEKVKDELSKDIYSINDVLNELEINAEEFLEYFLTPNTQHMKSFKLRQRALHVIQESLRVQRFKSTCEEPSEDNCNLQRLSEYMEESHVSLRHLYECSHPSLDYLVDISKEFGIGARLTGAGWGGCIVALCDSLDRCQRYIDFLKEKYYKDLPQAKGLDLDNVVFATSPQNGAEIFIP